ncbi:MAG: glycosyltransferase family 39 protein [Patescibacteria group bacterium]
MKDWLKKNKWTIIIFMAIILTAAFLRFYRQADYMTFLGDEGRDAMAVKKILVDHEFPLIGPPTSFGNIHLGPLYYYMMAAVMAILGLNPVVAAGMVAFLGVATVAMIFYLARKWFGLYGAIIASFLYAISPMTIILSRSSWNPNPVPFFSLLAFIGLVKARESHNYLWLILTGAALAFALQMHYLTLILLPLFGILWLIELTSPTIDKKYFRAGTIVAIIVFLLLMSPLIIYDMEYDQANLRAFLEMFTGSQVIGLNFQAAALNIPTIYFFNLINFYMAGGNLWLAALPALIILFFSYKGLKDKKDKNFWVFKSLGMWLVIGLIGLSLIRQRMNDQYLEFLNFVPYLLLGGVINLVARRYRLAILIMLTLFLGFINLQKNPLLYPANKQLARTQEITKFIIEQSNDQPFNFALIPYGGNYDMAYQFYLWKFRANVQSVLSNKTSQLFVVCEYTICEPTTSSISEISAFGASKIVAENNINGIRIFRLGHAN